MSQFQVFDRGDHTKVEQPKAPGEPPQRHDVADSSAEFPSQKNCFHRRTCLDGRQMLRKAI